MFLVICRATGALVEITPSIRDAVSALEGMRHGVMYRRDAFGRLVPVGMRREGRTVHAGNAR